MFTLYLGDNLTILRNHIPSESVDLIYLDPPFCTGRDFGAFTDKWTWNEDAYQQLLDEYPNPKLHALIDAVLAIHGRKQLAAYLVFMLPRLAELHRILKPTGSLYLHCDPKTSHYLKATLDALFKPPTSETRLCGNALLRITTLAAGGQRMTLFSSTPSPAATPGTQLTSRTPSQPQTVGTSITTSVEPTALTTSPRQGSTTTPQTPSGKVSTRPPLAGTGHHLEKSWKHSWAKNALNT